MDFLDKCDIYVHMLQAEFTYVYPILEESLLETQRVLLVGHPRRAEMSFKPNLHPRVYNLGNTPSSGFLIVQNLEETQIKQKSVSLLCLVLQKLESFYNSKGQ